LFNYIKEWGDRGRENIFPPQNEAILETNTNHKTNDNNNDNDNDNDNDNPNHDDDDPSNDTNKTNNENSSFSQQATQAGGLDAGLPKEVDGGPMGSLKLSNNLSDGGDEDVVGVESQLDLMTGTADLSIPPTSSPLLLRKDENSNTNYTNDDEPENNRDTTSTEVEGRDRRTNQPLRRSTEPSPTTLTNTNHNSTDISIPDSTNDLETPWHEVCLSKSDDSTTSEDNENDNNNDEGREGLTQAGDRPDWRNDELLSKSDGEFLATKKRSGRVRASTVRKSINYQKKEIQKEFEIFKGKAKTTEEKVKGITFKKTPAMRKNPWRAKSKDDDRRNGLKNLLGDEQEEQESVDDSQFDELIWSIISGEGGLERKSNKFKTENNLLNRQPCFSGKHFITWIQTQLALPNRNEACKYSRGLLLRGYLRPLSSIIQAMGTTYFADIFDIQNNSSGSSGNSGGNNSGNNLSHSGDHSVGCSLGDSGDSKEFKDSPNTFYYLQWDCIKFKNCLNLQKINLCSPHSPELLMESLNNSLNTSLQQNMLESGGCLQLASLRSSREYYDFCIASTQLQKLEMSQIVGKNKRRAFILNLYLILLIHTQIKFGIPSKEDRPKFFADNYYIIKEHIINLNTFKNSLRKEKVKTDKEIGILADMNHDLQLQFVFWGRLSDISEALQDCFTPKDDSMATPIPEPSLRSSFGGSYSHSVLPEFSSSPTGGVQLATRYSNITPFIEFEHVDHQLYAISSHYLQRTVKINYVKRTIIVPKIFKWASEFFETPEAILRYLSLHFPEGSTHSKSIDSFLKTNKFCLKYGEYDWLDLGIANLCEKERKKGMKIVKKIKI